MYSDCIYARFTLSFTTAKGGRVTLRDLSGKAVEEITVTQTELGSSRFEVTDK